jgi:iron complex transport system ATP-binding protein
VIPLFQLVNAGVRYGDAEILRSVSLAFSAGEFVAIAGPNGAGKSTLLSLLAGLKAPSSGVCRLGERDAHAWNRRDFARRVAVVEATDVTSFPFTASEVVYMGRMPHQKGMYETPEDDEAVAHALQRTGMMPFRDREFRTLSSGEKQRVLLASALAQSPEVLLLDEPAAHLDLRHQVELHQLLRELSQGGLLVVAITHDLNLAAAYASRLILMHKGRIRADGPAAEVLRTSLIEEVFEVHVAMHHTSSGQPWMLYGE